MSGPRTNDPSGDVSGELNPCGLHVSPEMQGWNTPLIRYRHRPDIEHDASPYVRCDGCMVHCSLRCRCDASPSVSPRPARFLVLSQIFRSCRAVSSHFSHFLFRIPCSSSQVSCPTCPILQGSGNFHRTSNQVKYCPTYCWLELFPPHHLSRSPKADCQGSSSDP